MDQTQRFQKCMSLAMMAKNKPQSLAKTSQSTPRKQRQKESGLHPMNLKRLHSSYEEPSIFHQRTAPAAQNEPSVFTNESVFWIEDNSIKKEIA